MCKQIFKHCIIAQIVALAVLAIGPKNSVIALHTDDEQSSLHLGVSCRTVRSTDGSGFHRNLRTSVYLTLLETLPNGNSYQVLINETIPSGMFVDLYQTDGLHRFGGPKVYSEVDIDLELPEFLSQFHQVYVYNTLSYINGSLVAIDVTLPVHLRYHRPNDVLEYDHVVVVPPQVLLGGDLSSYWDDRLDTSSSVEAPCWNNTSVTCRWIPVMCLGAKNLTFEVPVGKLSHYNVVVFGTLMVTLFATAILIVTILHVSPKYVASKEQ